jgi:predicted ester cyclase
MWWSAFSPSVEPLEGHWTTDGIYVAEVHFRGTHTGHFLGIPPTDNQLDLPVVIIVTGFPSGLLGGERMYWDMGTLLRQLGIEGLPTEQVV